MSKRIYLSLPYSGNEEESFKAANKFTAELMNRGYIVFSPISMSHPVATQCELPGGWEFWRKLDTAFIEWCEELHVLCLDGWENSTGVTAEIGIAEGLGKTIVYWNMDGTILNVTDSKK